MFTMVLRGEYRPCGARFRHAVDLEKPVRSIAFDQAFDRFRGNGAAAVYPGLHGGQIEICKMGDYLEGHEIGNGGTKIDSALSFLNSFKKKQGMVFPDDNTGAANGGDTHEPVVQGRGVPDGHDNEHPVIAIKVYTFGPGDSGGYDTFMGMKASLGIAGGAAACSLLSLTC